MKRIWLAVVTAVALVLSVYAIYAGSTVNGVKIYLVSYETGRVFAATYIIAGILAVACWLWPVIHVIKIAQEWWKSGKQKTVSGVEEGKSVKKKEKSHNAEELKCIGCGAVLAANAKFCTQCGKKVE